MTGIIRLEGLSFLASHGATEEERRSQRRFEVDVQIETPIARAAETDDLAHTVDYQSLAEIVLAAGTGRTYRLLEAVAAAILQAVAERVPDAGIAVEVRKLAPPAPGTPRHASVRLSRPARG
jgi:7,8-dihydroneopterin aldolase/epimerase/oxygenase